MKINLILQNSDVFIFDVQDWFTLRKKYRITGEFIGSLNSIPVLPLKLLPEEVVFLLEKQIAELSRYVNKRSCNDEFERSLLEEQRQLYKSHRRKQLEQMFDKIIASKRKKGDGREDSEIFEDELKKSCEVTADKMIWPIMLKPQSFSCEKVEYNSHLYTSDLRCAVFKNLWERGYYITSGQKFGGDFLVYLGDPVIYHAIFIVRCVQDIKKSMKSHEIVAFGRLGTSVKKKAVLAAIVDDNVSYITINWIDD